MSDWGRFEKCCNCIRLDVATRLIGVSCLLVSLGKSSQVMEDTQFSRSGAEEFLLTLYVKNVPSFDENISNTCLPPPTVTVIISGYNLNAVGLFLFYLVKLEDVRNFILDDLYGKVLFLTFTTLFCVCKLTRNSTLHYSSYRHSD